MFLNPMTQLNCEIHFSFEGPAKAHGSTYLANELEASVKQEHDRTAELLAGTVPIPIPECPKTG